MMLRTLDFDGDDTGSSPDPRFPVPIYATLVEVEGGEGLQLIWSRPVARD